MIRIRPRPFTAYISGGRSVLATTLDGLADGGPDHGLFVHETRLLSLWRYCLDRDPPSPNALSPVRQNQWLGYYVAPAPGVPPPPADDGSGQVPAASQQTLELRVMRTIDGGLHEDIDLTNYANAQSSFVFLIECDADFADQSETRERRQRGALETEWNAQAQRLTFDYVNGVVHRAAEVRIDADTQARFAYGQLLFDSPSNRGSDGMPAFASTRSSRRRVSTRPSIARSTVRRW